MPNDHERNLTQLNHNTDSTSTSTIITDMSTSQTIIDQIESRVQNMNEQRTITKYYLKDLPLYLLHCSTQGLSYGSAVAVLDYDPT